MRPYWPLAALWLLAGACSPPYDVVIRGGTIYDGSGTDPVVGDLALKDDTIAAIGDVRGRGRVEVGAALQAL